MELKMCPHGFMWPKVQGVGCWLCENSTLRTQLAKAVEALEFLRAGETELRKEFVEQALAEIGKPGGE